MNLAKPFIIAGVIGLTGCVTTSPKTISALSPAASIGNSVTCKGPCTDEWERAQLWLVKHSEWKIQMATNVLIQTHNPVGSSPSYGFSITKEPIGNGKYSISATMTCGNMFGCTPDEKQTRNALYYYIKHGKDLLINAGDVGYSLR